MIAPDAHSGDDTRFISMLHAAEVLTTKPTPRTVYSGADSSHEVGAPMLTGSRYGVSTIVRHWSFQAALPEPFRLQNVFPEKSLTIIHP